MPASSKAPCTLCNIYKAWLLMPGKDLACGVTVAQSRVVSGSFCILAQEFAALAGDPACAVAQHAAARCTWPQPEARHG
jgi:hypothetical protein